VRLAVADHDHAVLVRPGAEAPSMPADPAPAAPRRIAGGRSCEAGDVRARPPRFDGE
jgi:hypothetical protein